MEGVGGKGGRTETILLGLAAGVSLLFWFMELGALGGRTMSFGR